MKISEIPISDVLKKKLWRIETEDLDDFLDSPVQEISTIGKKDIVLHSAVILERNVAVHPALVSKYYEDGGEVGEYFIHLDGSWRFLDSSVKFTGETENAYLGYVSTRDIHEYQSGSFDNRKHHYERFDFYAEQHGKGIPKEFSSVATRLPKKLIALSPEDQIVSLRDILIAAKNHQLALEVAAGNRRVTEAIQLAEYIKTSEAGRQQLKKLLKDPEPYIQATMMYQLRDIFGRDCLKMIKKKSKEDSIEGLAAQMNLKDPKFMATIRG